MEGWGFILETKPHPLIISLMPAPAFARQQVHNVSRPSPSELKSATIFAPIQAGHSVHVVHILCVTQKRGEKKKIARTSAIMAETVKYPGDGGAVGDRTPDLCNAIAALSQLSYGPIFSLRSVALIEATLPWQVARYALFSSIVLSVPDALSVLLHRLMFRRRDHRRRPDRPHHRGTALRPHP